MCVFVQKLAVLQDVDSLEFLTGYVRLLLMQQQFDAAIGIINSKFLVDPSIPADGNPCVGVGLCVHVYMCWDNSRHFFSFRRF